MASITTDWYSQEDDCEGQDFPDDMHAYPVTSVVMEPAELPAEVDQHDTADGRGKSLEESLARFARCIGRDRRDANLADWRSAAHLIAAEQMGDIRLALTTACNLTGVAIDAPIIAGGIGAPQIFDLARHMGRPAHAFAEIANATPECADWATRCAPAASIALLAEGDAG